LTGHFVGKDHGSKFKVAGKMLMRPRVRVIPVGTVNVGPFDGVRVTETVQGPNEKRLFNDLFSVARGYNRLERPVVNDSEALVVKFGLVLQQIIDVVSSSSSTVLCLSGSCPHRLIDIRIFPSRKTCSRRGHNWITLKMYKNSRMGYFFGHHDEFCSIPVKK